MAQTQCLFCGKSQRVVPVLITGKIIAGRGPRSAGICDDCVEKCMLILLKRKYPTEGES